MTELDSLAVESRRFPPPPGFAAKAVVTEQVDRELRAAFEKDWEGTWARLGREELVWSKPFTKPFEGDLEHPRWFDDGQLNATVQCLDR